MGEKERNRCPVCGHEFDEVGPANTCPRHLPVESFSPDELVAEDDDYAYCV